MPALPRIATPFAWGARSMIVTPALRLHDAGRRDGGQRISAADTVSSTVMAD
jgi:hypothetical protein